MLPRGIVITCHELVVSGSHLTGSLNDEVCTIGCLTIVLGGQAITPLSADVAIEKLGKAFAATVVAVTGDDGVLYRLVGARSYVSQILEILCEISVCAKAPFAHLQPDVAALNRLDNLNPEVLVGCFAVSFIEHEVFMSCVSLRQSFAFALVDERPATCCGVIYVAANSFCIACEVTAVDVPRLPVTGRIAARVATGDEEVPFGHDSLLGLYHNPGFCTVGIVRIEGVTHLGVFFCIDQAGITFTTGTAGTRQSRELHILCQSTL